MSLHAASLSWSRTTPDFTYDTYDRTHRVRFGGGVEAPMSSAPEYKGNAELPNPEEMLAAALGSCHMLTFLAIAARSRLVVDSYEDTPTAHLEKNDAGKLAVTKIVLHPRITFAGEAPDAEKLRSLHDKAHHNCFIGSSITSEVVVEID
jgi:organic hydroperoxide reductase OsmC/OhrA